MTTATKSEKKPKTTAEVTRAYFRALAERDLDTAVSLWRPGCIDHLHGLGELKAPGGIRAYFESLFGAFPDWEFEIVEMAASGKSGAVRWRTSATFAGPGRFQGIAPTGARIEIEGCDMLRVEDGEIVANNAYTNAAQLAQQLGVLPASGSFGERAMTAAFNARTATAAAVKRLRER